MQVRQHILQKAGHFEIDAKGSAAYPCPKKAGFISPKVRQLILAQRKLASKEACVNEDAKVLQLSFAMTKACFSTQDVASRWLCHQVVQKAHIHKKLWPKFDKCHSHIAVMSPDKGIYIHRLSPKVLEHL